MATPAALVEELRLVESYCATALRIADEAVDAAIVWARSGEFRRPHEVKRLLVEPEAPGLTDGALQAVEPVRWALEALERDLKAFSQGGWMRDPDHPDAPAAAETLESVRNLWVECLQARTKDVERAIADVHTSLHLPWSLDWLTKVRQTYAQTSTPAESPPPRSH